MTAVQFARRHRLTGLGTRVFAGGLVLAMLAVPTGSRWLLVAGCFVAVLPWATLLVIPRQRLEFAVESPPRARVGAPLPLRIVLRNTGRRHLPSLQLRCERPLFDAVNGAIPVLRRGAEATWEVLAAPTVRGAATGARLELTASDPFGLSVRRAARLLPLRLLVAPRAVPDVPLAERLGTGDQIELAGLRPWRHGDPAAAVAWRTSARRGVGPGSALMVREWQGSEPDELRLGISGGSPTTVERALEVAAAVGCAALARRRTVLLVLGRSTTRVIGRNELLDLLAVLTAASVPEMASASCDILICCRGYEPPARPTGLLVVDRDGKVESR